MQFNKLTNGLVLGGALALAFSTTGCDEDAVRDAVNETVLNAAMIGAQDHYPEIVYASYVDARDAAVVMDQAIDAFVADPTDANLVAAQQAWLDAREPYLETEVYRFYDGPIDNAEDGPEGLLNAWPLDESHIDSVDGDVDAGIINDTSITISADQLMELNEQGGEENVATGYHAIEFLLWGQDMSADGPGDRAYTDFVDGEDGTLQNADRRRDYLATVSDLLVSHLDELVAAWDPDAQDNYRAEFEAAEHKEATRRILTGMTILAGFETGGERLQAALTSGDQEDEHSCFSDNTHRDMIQDVVGIKNVWEGVYTTEDGEAVAGTGINAVFAALNSDLADQVQEQLDQSLELANNLPVPFDQAIIPSNTEGNDKVADLVASLRALEGLFEDGFEALELSIPVAE